MAAKLKSGQKIGYFAGCIHIDYTREVFRFITFHYVKVSKMALKSRFGKNDGQMTANDF